MLLKRINRVFLYSYLLFNTFSCAYINQDLKPYQEEVLLITNQYCNSEQYFHPTNNTIYFYPLKDNDIGVCIKTYYTYIIQIDPYYWLNATEDEKYELIVHEFSHCLLYKNHVDNYSNYMYYSAVGLDRNTVTKQYIEDLKEHCHGK